MILNHCLTRGNFKFQVGGLRESSLVGKTLSLFAMTDCYNYQPELKWSSWSCDSVTTFTEVAKTSETIAIKTLLRIPLI